METLNKPIQPWKEISRLIMYSIIKLAALLTILTAIYNLTEPIIGWIIAFVASIIIILIINLILKPIEKNIFKEEKEIIKKYSEEQKKYENEMNKVN